MLLSATLANNDYKVTDLRTDMRLRQKLEAMGLVPGQTVTVMAATSGGRVVRLKNSRLAIGNDLGALLEVEPCVK
jgi:Fe2+ transport system protein FeoA